MLDRPRARTEGVVSERVDEDLVVYDERSQTAHSLSAAAASVWELCDGQLSRGEIAGQLGLEPALVERAIEELSGCALLDDGPAIESTFISRREAAKKLAQVGGVAFAAPMIYSVAIGPATAAASTCTTNLNGTGMPGTATCDNVNDANFGTSHGQNHCCGVCYVDPGGTLMGNVYCPTSASCVPQGTTPAGNNAALCCSGQITSGHHCR